MPDWYDLVQAARYLGVPPWELLDRPVAWSDMALISMNAEAHARQMKERQR